MMLLGLLRSSPTIQAICATLLVFGLVAGGVGMLRRDARVQAVQQCTAEKEVAGLRRELADQKRIAAAHEADSRQAKSVMEQHAQQLAASDEALQKAQADAEALRKKVATNPGESDYVFGPDDEWVTRRVRPAGSASAPAAGRGR